MDQETRNFFESFESKFAEMKEQMALKSDIAEMKNDLKSDIEDLNFRFINIQNGVAIASHERDELESLQTTYLVSDPTGFNSKRVIAGKRF